MEFALSVVMPLHKLSLINDPTVHGQLPESMIPSLFHVSLVDPCFAIRHQLYYQWQKKNSNSFAERDKENIDII